MKNQKKKRICLIGPFPPYKGGISGYNYLFAKELKKSHELLLISYSKQYPVFLYGKKNQKDTTFDGSKDPEILENVDFCIDSANPLSWQKTCRKIISFRPDTVIFPWWVIFWAPMYLYFFYQLKKHKIGIMMLCHNVFEHESNFFKKMLAKYVLKQADFFIVHTKVEKKKLHDFLPDAKIIKHPIPLYNFEEKISARIKEDKTFNILFFGFVREYKGLDTLLKAMVFLENKNITLKIAGEFWKNKDKYLEIIEKNRLQDKIEIIDKYIPSHEVAEYFLTADVVALPYKSATGSAIIPMAYSYGKPVLITDVDGLSETVDDCKTGKIVAPNDPKAFVEGINWFYENRNTDFQTNINNFVKKNMSWHSLVKEIDLFCN